MVDLPDDLIPYGQPKSANDQRAGWHKDVPADAVQLMPPTPTGKAGDEAASEGWVGRTLNAFGQGYADGWGTDPLSKWINPLIGPPIKDMTKEQLEHPVGMMKSLNETYIRPLAFGTAWIKRAATAWYPGMQSAGVQIGEELGGTEGRRAARDIVSLPDAFMGSPGALARPHLPGERKITGGMGDHPNPNVANDLNLIGPKKPALNDIPGTPVEVAKAVIEEPRALGPVHFDGTLAADGKIYTSEENWVRAGKSMGLSDEAARSGGTPVIVHADPDKLMTLKEWETFVEKKGASPSLIDGAEFAKREGIQGVKNPDGSVRIFDDRIVQAANEEPVLRPQNLSAAMTPKELLPPEQKFRQATDTAGNIRMELFDMTDDAMNVIRKSAQENDGFKAARAGEMSLAHRQQLADIMGIKVEGLPDQAIRNLKNDHEVRATFQAFVNSAEDVGFAVREAKTTGKIEDLIEVQKLLQRHDILQEAVAGYKAEWGRTGQVQQEFADRVKDGQSLGKWLKDKRGRSIDDLRDMVNMLSTLDPRTQLPKALHDLRKPNSWKQTAYVWVNWLLSGPASQAAYLIADTMFAAVDVAVTTPIAGGIGAVRQAFSSTKVERVYAGEAVAKAKGYVAGFPDAVIAFGEALRNDIRTPMVGFQGTSWKEVMASLPKLLKDESTGITLPPKVGGLDFNPVTGQSGGGIARPIPGVAGAIIGTPVRTLGGIQSFFEHWNYRAKIHSEAYRAAINDGFTAGSASFRERYAGHVMFPTEESIAASIGHAEYMTYIAKLGPQGRRLAGAINDTDVGKFIIPFTHVPPNVAKIAIEHSPAAFLGPELRKTLRGENGIIARDTGYARLIAGSAFGAWMFSLAANDSLTGDGPIGAQEKSQWMLTNKQTAVRIGDKWVDYKRLGTLGMLMRATANLHDIKYDVTQGEYAEAAQRLALAAGHFLTDSGLSTLSDMVQALMEPERKGEKFINGMAASAMPFSSLGYQLGNAYDPVLRDTTDFISALKSKVPFASRTNDPALDWRGREQPNPRQGLGAIFPTSPASSDPIDLELQRLDITPARMHKTIGTVELEKSQWLELQQHFGEIVTPLLQNLMQSKEWDQMSVMVRRPLIEKMIASARSQATTYLQMKYWDTLGSEIIDAKVEGALGIAPRTQPYRRPAPFAVDQ